MSKAKVAHLLASVWIPIGEPLNAFADRLTRLMPGFTFGFWRIVESMLQPAMGHLAMFAEIVLERV